MAGVWWTTGGWLLLLLSGSLLSCESGGDSADPDATGAVVADTSSRTDALVVLLAAQVASEGSYLHPGHMRSITLSVDGEPWGTYSATDSEQAGADTSKGAWLMIDERTQALFVAPLLEGEEDLSRLETAGEWSSLLNRQLAPGDHVANLQEVVLSNGTRQVTRKPALLVPFTILEGFRSALVGELEISLEEGALP